METASRLMPTRFRLPTRWISRGSNTPATLPRQAATRWGSSSASPADTVIIAAGSCPDNELYEELKSKGMEVFLVGDAKQARKAIEAIQEGYEAGLQV